MKTWIIILVLIASLLGATAQILLKRGMTDFTFKDLFFNIPLFIGVFLYGSAFILYNITLKFEDVSLVYPIIACSYIFVVILAFFFLKEPLSLNKFIGSVMIVGGVYMISWMG